MTQSVPKDVKTFVAVPEPNNDESPALRLSVAEKFDIMMYCLLTAGVSDKGGWRPFIARVTIGGTACVVAAWISRENTVMLTDCGFEIGEDVHSIPDTNHLVLRGRHAGIEYMTRENLFLPVIKSKSELDEIQAVVRDALAEFSATHAARALAECIPTTEVGYGS